MSGDLNTINLGYACLNSELRKKNIFSSRTCRIKTLKEIPDTLFQLINKNLNDLFSILKWNAENKIRLFRVSSELFPFMSHPEYGYSLEPWFDELKTIGIFAKQNSIRLTMHVGQWTLLSSLKQDVTDKSIKDLNMHSEILNKMGCDYNSVIVIHGGRKDGKNEILKNFKKLNKDTQKRIAIENCEMCYKIEDLLEICEELNTPLILDYHHYNLNNTDNLKELMPRILNTRYKRNLRPKFHVSESCENANKNSLTSLRKHSDIIFNLPEDIPNNIDIMLEAKLKEQSVFYLRKKYNLI